MNTSKVKKLIHRIVGILGCLLTCVIDIYFVYTHAYIWAGLYTAMTVFLIYRYFKDYHNPEALYGANYSLIFCMLWLCYHEYTNLKRDLQAEKYGLVYNKIRKNLNIPIIPPDWHTEYKGDLSVDWEAKEGTHGHEYKSMGFDSLHEIEFERDTYDFNDTTRSLSILFKYAKGKSRDSLLYYYSYHDVKDTTLNLSRHQADSILDAAKIRKDY